MTAQRADEAYYNSAEGRHMWRCNGCGDEAHGFDNYDEAFYNLCRHNCGLGQ